jgi:3-isopropylmalate/(R)-2-methylmalate dehydratase small subunit
MILYAHARRVAGPITTDAIIAPAARAEGDPATLAALCLAEVDVSLGERAREGDVLVADAGFGAGAEPELAALALQAAGFAAVLCQSAAPTFVEAAHAVALPVIETPDVARLLDGALIRLDLAAGRIELHATGERFPIPPPPAAVLAAFQRTQMLTHMRRVVEDEGFDG